RAGGVAAVAAVRALVDDGGDDVLAVLAGDLDALPAVGLRVEAVLPRDGREVGVTGGAHHRDVLDGVGHSVLGAVVAASGAVAAAVLGRPLPEPVIGERSAAAVVGEVAGGRGAAAAAG